MEYYFTAQKLAVGYDNRPLIENIDFSLKRGEILTLIGPNGAGKSTILKSIARQLSLVSGSFRNFDPSFFTGLRFYAFVWQRCTA